MDRSPGWRACKQDPKTRFRSKKRTHVVNVKEESIVDVLWGLGIGNPVKFVCKITKTPINHVKIKTRSQTNPGKQSWLNFHLPLMISICFPYGLEFVFGFLPELRLPLLPGDWYCSVFALYIFIPDVLSRFSAYFLAGLGENWSFWEPLLLMPPDLSALVFDPEPGDLSGDSARPWLVLFLSGEPARSLSDPVCCISWWSCAKTMIFILTI